MYSITLDKGQGDRFLVSDACGNLLLELDKTTPAHAVLLKVTNAVHEAAQAGLLEYTAAAAPDYCHAWETEASISANVTYSKDSFIPDLGLNSAPTCTQMRLRDVPQLLVRQAQDNNDLARRLSEMQKKYAQLEETYTFNQKVAADMCEKMEETKDMLQVDLENVSIGKDGMTIDHMVITSNMPPDMLDKCLGLVREGFSLTRQLINASKFACKCEQDDEVKHP